MSNTDEWPDAYPLSWPMGWRRTPPSQMRSGIFQVSSARARDDMLHEFSLLGADIVVISTNVQTKRDGHFYASAPEPADPAVAVYFSLRGRMNVVACDTYNKLRDNMRAIGLSIASMRAIDRYGASQIFEQAFDGMRALPPEGYVKPWWEVLGWKEIPPTLDDAKKSHRHLIKIHDPDKGGDVERARELHEALAKARAHFEP